MILGPALKPLFFLFLMCLVFFNSQKSAARVFSYKDSWFTTYLRGSAGLSHLGDNAYDDTTGNNTKFDEEVTYNFSGELGLALQFSEEMVLRFGVEGLQAKNRDAKGVVASNPSNYIEVESSVLSFSPIVTAEYNYITLVNTRFYVLAGAGYSTIKVSNENTLSSGAATAYSYVDANPYKEAWVGKPTFSYHGGLGMEYFVFDNVTMSLDLGWRILHVEEFEYQDTITVIRGSSSTSVTKGATVRDNRGQTVDLDMGGLFVGLMFKFYIPQLR